MVAMAQGMNAPPTILDVIANLAAYPPDQYPGASFIAEDAPRTFTSNGTVWIAAGGSTPAIPLGQIAFGTGSSLSSSPQLMFDAAPQRFVVRDPSTAKVFDVFAGAPAPATFQGWYAPNGNPLAGVSPFDGIFGVFDPAVPGQFGFGCLMAPADRLVLAVDPNSHTIWQVDTKSANRFVEVFDQNSQIMWTADTKTGGPTPRFVWMQDETGQKVWQIATGSSDRVVSAFDANGAQMWFADTRLANRAIGTQDETAAFLTICDTRSVKRSWIILDELGNPVLELVGQSVNPSITCFTSLGLLNVKVAGLAALPTGNGFTVWASNGLKPTEAPGFGTGVQAAYSSGGPAGAGWYAVGTAALVAA